MKNQVASSVVSVVQLQQSSASHLLESVGLFGDGSDNSLKLIDDDADNNRVIRSAPRNTPQRSRFT